MKDEKKQLDELLSRSIFQILPSKEALMEVLLSQKKLRIYIGADVTGPQLHLGHATNFMLLENFRRLGHQVIIMFGDFTAMLGDPTDKSATRRQISFDEVNTNISTWKDQVSKILDFDDKENPALLRRNSEWLAEKNLSDVIGLASHFTVQQMLERDMFEKRIAEGKPVYLHEFLYPLLQGYDSVELNVDIEIGGSDQIFNMLAGRTLQKHFHQKEKFVIATTLLEDPTTGKKLMSKSEGDFIALNDAPNDMFGKIMALPDGTIIHLYTDCTYLSREEIGSIEKEMMDNSMNPRDAKVRLAREIVAIYHGDEAAQEAENYFVSTFSNKEIPSDIREVRLDVPVALLDFLVREGLATSKGDARRKVEQGGVELDGERIIDRDLILTPDEKSGRVLKCGKKDFRKIF